jgi:hypothetical protein
MICLTDMPALERVSAYAQAVIDGMVTSAGFTGTTMLLTACFGSLKVG